MYSIAYRPSAAKALRKLDPQTAKKVLTAVSDLARQPRPPGSVRLVGGQGECRIRVGDYRVIYDISELELVILVLRIGHRRDVYR